MNNPNPILFIEGNGINITHIISIKPYGKGCVVKLIDGEMRFKISANDMNKEIEAHYALWC